MPPTRRSVLAVLAVTALSTVSLPAAAADREVKRTLPLPADGRVEIDTYKGSITVTGWDRPEVEVVARVEPDGNDRDMARKVEDTEVRIEAHGSTVRLESDYSKVKKSWHFFSWNDGTLPFVHYTVKMPRAARLDVDDYKSRIEIADVAGAVDVETYKGSARLEGLQGRVRLETYKGEARLEYASLKESCDLKTYKGRIDVRLPRESKFTLDADAGRRGGVDCDFEVAGRATRSRSGDLAGEVNGGGPRVTLSTYKGELHVRSKG